MNPIESLVDYAKRVFGAVTREEVSPDGLEDFARRTDPKNTDSFDLETGRPLVRFDSDVPADVTPRLSPRED